MHQAHLHLILLVLLVRSSRGEKCQHHKKSLQQKSFRPSPQRVLNKARELWETPMFYTSVCSCHRASCALRLLFSRTLPPKRIDLAHPPHPRSSRAGGLVGVCGTTRTTVNAICLSPGGLMWRDCHPSNRSAGELRLAVECVNMVSPLFFNLPEVTRRAAGEIGARDSGKWFVRRLCSKLARDAAGYLWLKFEIFHKPAWGVRTDYHTERWKREQFVSTTPDTTRSGFLRNDDNDQTGSSLCAQKRRAWSSRVVMKKHEQAVSNADKK